MSFIDPLTNLVLSMDPLLAILIISFVLSLLITIAYKYFTDQELMKTLKADLQSAQKEMKKFKDNPEKMLSIQKNAMEKNMKYMMHSMKPTLITFIPILIVFGWLNSHFGYLPLPSGSEFDIKLTLNSNVYGYVEAFTPKINNSIILLEKDSIKEINSRELSYKFKALSSGTWDIIFFINNKTDYPVQVKIDNKEYSTPVLTKFKSREIKQITIGNTKKIVLDLFGWKLGWIGAYIIFSIVFSMGLRKLFKVH